MCVALFLHLPCIFVQPRQVAFRCDTVDATPMQSMDPIHDARRSECVGSRPGDVDASLMVIIRIGCYMDMLSIYNYMTYLW